MLAAVDAVPPRPHSVDERGALIRAEALTGARPFPLGIRVQRREGEPVRELVLFEIRVREDDKRREKRGDRVDRAIVDGVPNLAMSVLTRKGQGGLDLPVVQPS